MPARGAGLAGDGVALEIALMDMVLIVLIVAVMAAAGAYWTGRRGE